MVRALEKPDTPSPPAAPGFRTDARGPDLAASFLAAGVSAGMLALSCPPYDQGWLAWLAPAPFFWALLGGVPAQHLPSGSAGVAADREPILARSSFSLGFVWGFLLLLLLVPWFVAFTPIGYVAAAVYWGLLAGAGALLLAALVRRAPPGWAPGVAAAGYTVLEWLRARGTLAFPWGSLASTQYRYLAVLQVLDLCGSYGLTLLMALAAASLAGMARRPYRPGAVRWGSAVALLVALACGRGVWILREQPPAGETARVAIVQASESRKAPGARVICVSPIEDYEAWTRAAMREGAELVVWPESSSEADIVHDPRAQARMASLLKGSRAYLLTGSFVLHPPSRQVMNAAAMLSPSARVRGLYAKVLLVPFGEYLPARPLLGWTARLGMPASDMRAGDLWTPLRWPRGLVGVSICYESAFGEVSRAMVNQGANLLAVLTSDGWAGRTAVGFQHLAFAPLRAVETRRSVVRAAATGVSELIDPYGRVWRSLWMFDKGVILTEMPLRRDRTFYVRLGEWPVWLSWLVLLAAALAGPRVYRINRAATLRTPEYPT